MFLFYTVEPMPWYKRAAYWVCGIENMANNQQHVMPEMKMDIEEDPCHASIVNTLAITLLLGTAFMVGYYA